MPRSESNVLAGITGPTGAPGADGAKIFTGIDDPPSDLGSDGDCFLNTDTGNWFRKGGGVWGVAVGNLTGPQGVKGDRGDQGVEGLRGAPGATMLHGTVDPTTEGSDEDYYLNTISGDWFQKIEGSWGAAIGNLTGPQGVKGDQGDTGATGATGDTGAIGPAGADGATGPVGADGATILHGAADPTNEGNDGDYFLNTASGDWFKKVSGSWGVAIGNLTGPVGATGPAGADGATGPAGADGATILHGATDPTNEGNDGDYFLNTVSGDWFKKVSGSWGVAIGNLTGPAGATGPVGADGATGPAGADGATILHGAADPTNEGNDGDYFLNTASGDWFEKVSGSWGVAIGNLTGPQGIQGVTGDTGATGADGAVWFNGTDDPSVTPPAGAADGDFYLRSDGNVWKRSGGTWSPTGISLLGASGAGTGDVNGPASSVSGNFPTFNNASGDLLADSGKGPADFLPSDAPDIDKYTEPTDSVSSSGGALTLDLATGLNFHTTLTENITTFTISNWPTGKRVSVTLELIQAATAVSFDWGAVKWDGGTAPDISVDSGVYFISFTSRDGGATVYGFKPSSKGMS